jgi:hypothetical protein
MVWRWEAAMCPSPEVDVVAGVAIAGIGVDALRHTLHPRTLPLALLPGLLAVHTLSSAPVRLGADGTLPAAVADPAPTFFMGVAVAWLPVYVPWAIVSLEPPGWRREAWVARPWETSLGRARSAAPARRG